MPVYADKATGRLFIQFQLRGETYKERLPAGTTRKDAARLETKIKNDLLFESHGVHSQRAETLYEDWLCVYLEYAEANYSKVSFDRAVLICRASLPFFKGRALRAIKPADVERFKTARAALPTMHGRTRKPATLLRELSILSKVFSLAVRNAEIESNPCARVERPKFDNVQNRILRREDEARLFAAMHSEWSRDICRLVLNTGLRSNDVMSLTRFECDLNEGVIRLVQGKTKRRVEIPMNETVREIITRRMSAASPLLLASPRTGTAGGSVRHALLRACKRAGIPPLTIRDLRRTFGTRLHEDGFDDSTVAQLLGHSDLRSIHRYKRGSEIKKQAVLSLESAKYLPDAQTKKASNT